ncbi:alpha/beta fold hydrolase [Salsipaludibacter albus]|uniref:alpha/beta fold hydrolase n=1 Tax=Salsipaludibacter albus TaxID=2849650 RepID=UPI001EE3D979|nr:alpha/beta hydrolase [Salsipaludibacter albus]MBY5162734.1 alpha/beta hydrolase [Salsipaludibacter albus]
MPHRTWRVDHGDAGVRRRRQGGGLDLATLEASPAEPTRPPALLVPGFTGSKEDWSAVVEPLAATGRRIVAIDLPGQFESAGWPDRADHGFARLGVAVRDVAAGLTAETGHRPHLVGHSLGGLVGRAAVLDDPGAVASFVLLDSGPRSPDRDGARAVRRKEVASAAGGGMAAIHARLRALDGVDERMPEAERDHLRDRFVASSMAAYLGMFDALLAEPDRVAPLAATGVPTCVVRGEHDRVFSVEEVDDMATRLGGRTVVVPLADHSPALEHPAATVAVLAAFWEGVEAGDRRRAR